MNEQLQPVIDTTVTIPELQIDVHDDVQTSDFIASFLRYEHFGGDIVSTFETFSAPPAEPTTAEAGVTSTETAIQTTEPLVIENDEANVATTGLHLIARLKQKVRNSELLQTAWQESLGARWRDRASLLGVLVGYGVDISPLTEWTTTKIGEHVLRSVAEHQSVPLSAGLTAATVGAFGGIYSLATGSNMLHTLKTFPESVKQLANTKFGKSDALLNSRHRPWYRKFSNVYTAGPATVNLEDSLTDPSFMAEHKGPKRTIESALLVTVGSIALGGIGGGSIQAALNAGNPELGYRILGDITNPLLWTGVFLYFRGVDYREKRKMRLANDTQEQQETVQ